MCVDRYVSLFGLRKENSTEWVGDLNDRNSFSHSTEALKSEVKVPARWAFFRFAVVSFPQCLHMASFLCPLREGEREEGDLVSSSLLLRTPVLLG